MAERNKLEGKKLLVCNCERTMALDGKALGAALGTGELKVATQLCRAQLSVFEGEAQGADEVIVACTQESPMFLEVLGEMGDDAPASRFVNIRENAGWSAAGKAEKPSSDLTAKMAALIAEGAIEIPDTASVSMVSEGSLLVLGRDQSALEAAKQVADKLDVTLILTEDAEVIAPAVMDVPIFQGRVTGATGHFGAFEVTVEHFQSAAPSSRGMLEFEGAGQTGASACDMILDLRGGSPLFTAPEKRDGYVNPDPGNPALVMKALFELAEMVGEFEKPRYVDYDPNICAYSSSRITGCTRCLDNCPTGAITPDGDKVAYDPYICAGCGICAVVCPTGAAKYALPGGDAVWQRLRTLLTTYRAAGGRHPQILVHDRGRGSEALDMLARFGDGLPANVIPFAVNQATQVGLDFVLTAAAMGAEHVSVLLPPDKREDRSALETELGFAEAVLEGLGYGGGRTHVIEEIDPDAIARCLAELTAKDGMPTGDFLPMGRKRAILGLALDHLHSHAPTPVDEVALPDGAPFGAVNVDVEGCTLCLSCVGACPTGALADNPDMPQLSFSEAACVQCGLCRNTCPESVISLTPRLSFREEAKRHVVVKEEAPFQCIRCGKPFAVESSINRMLAKLEGHSMFQGSDKLDRLKMCDDCRVVVMTEDDDNPFRAGIVPKPRTTDDYLREREELRQHAHEDMKEKGLLDEEPKGNA